MCGIPHIYYQLRLAALAAGRAGFAALEAAALGAAAEAEALAGAAGWAGAANTETDRAKRDNIITDFIVFPILLLTTYIVCGLDYNRFAFYVLPLHQDGDQPAPGTRTRPFFFAERIILIAETNHQCIFLYATVNNK